MKRMRLDVFAALLAVLSLFAGEGVRTAQAKPWVTAYVGDWWLGADGNGTMPISKINFSGMTVCDFMSVLPTTSAPFIDTTGDIHCSQLLTAAAHAAGVKCTFTIGAWGTESAFRTACSSANLPAFVGNLVSFLKECGYDGIDVDWEPFNGSDTTLWHNLITALRQSLPSPQYLITVTGGWGSPYAAYASVQGYVDQINIMTYDFDTDAPGYNSWYTGSVYSDGVVIPADNTTPVPSCDYVSGLYEKAGVQVSKLGIGCEPGGELWQGITGPNQSISNVTSFKVDIPYTTIMSQYYRPGEYHWDSGAEACYLSHDTSVSSDDYFLTYDDTTALKAKLAYVQNSHLGGVIIYEIGMSYDKNTGANPFLQVSSEFLNGAGQASTVTDTPVVAIASPSNGVTLSGTVNVQVNASGTGLTGVQVQVDGSCLGGVMTSYPCSDSLNTCSLSNGTHCISALAYNSTGDTSRTSISVNVYNAVTPTSAGELVVYGDTLVSPWMNVSYNATTDFANTSPVYSGSYSIKVRSINWGALYLHDGNWGASDYVDCSKYDSLRFWVYSKSKLSYTVFFQNNAGQKFTSVATPNMPSGTWTQVSIPVAALNPNNYDVQYIGIMANSSGREVYYVDGIALGDPAPPKVSKPVMDVFEDSLAAPWQNASWAAAVDYSNGNPVYAGKKSIQVSAAAWGALSVHYGTWGATAINPNVLDSLHFEVYSATPANLALLLERDSGGTFKDVYVSAPANAWTRISVAVSSLNPSDLTFNRIDIISSSSSADTFYVDNFEIDSVSAAGGTQKGAIAGVNENGNIPAKFTLEQNYPNPFNPSTTIEFSLPAAQHAVLKVYDVLGEQVATLFDGYASAGVHYVIWSPKDLSSGVYLYRLQLKERSMSMTGRMLYLK